MDTDSAHTERVVLAGEVGVFVIERRYRWYGVDVSMAPDAFGGARDCHKHSVGWVLLVTQVSNILTSAKNQANGVAALEGRVDE